MISGNVVTFQRHEKLISLGLLYYLFIYLFLLDGLLYFVYFQELVLRLKKKKKIKLSTLDFKNLKLISYTLDLKYMRLVLNF